jgi:hypothetical protein
MPSPLMLQLQDDNKGYQHVLVVHADVDTKGQQAAVAAAASMHVIPPAATLRQRTACLG